MGFPVPLKEWFSNELKEFMQDTFASQKMRQREFFNSKAILANFDRGGALFAQDLGSSQPRTLASAVPRPCRRLSSNDRASSTCSKSLHNKMEDDMKVFITGGSGQVGSTVADLLLARGDTVLVDRQFRDWSA